MEKVIDRSIFEFLLKNEENFIGIFEKLNENNKNNISDVEFKIFYDKNVIDSLIIYTNYGSIYPLVKPQYINETINFINNSDYVFFSIYGEKDVIDKIIKFTNYKPRDLIEYHTMTLTKDNFYLFNNSKQNFNKDVLCRKCELKDFKYLKTLQYMYHKEEVYQNDSYYPYEAEMSAFKNLLKERVVYAIFDKYQTAISKVNTNGESPNFFQIGGMYTLKEYRKNGYGEFCLFNLILDIFNNYDKKGVGLFVKKNNTNAISLYKKMGFIIKGETAIAYF